MILLPVIGAVWLAVGGLFTWYHPGVMWNTLSAVGEEVNQVRSSLPCVSRDLICGSTPSTLFEQ